MLEALKTAPRALSGLLFCTHGRHTALDQSPLLDGRCAAMLAMIAAMMRRVHLTDSDLEIAAKALRALAVRYRADAARQRNPIVRDGFEKHASECERLAERMKRFGGGGPNAAR